MMKQHSSLFSLGKNAPCAILLAGGLGTRLKEAVPELPKCMAPVNQRPFLFYVINHLRMQGIRKLIFSLGYKHKTIVEYLNTAFQSLDFNVVVEEEPLGTGGAIALAIQQANTENVFVVNGDTLFKFNAAALLHQHNTTGAACTLALKPMQHFDRYGVVNIGSNGRITSFREKHYAQQGMINAGVYLINKNKFLQNIFPEKFSFEKDYLEKHISDNNFFGQPQHEYFIDIGIPEDYRRAQTELHPSTFQLRQTDKTWTLFLDRDGVINRNKAGSYVFSADEFEFMEGAPALFKKLNNVFHRIIIVTNQRGIGRGLMSEKDLKAIHKKMLDGITAAGGNIDGIYFADSVCDKSFMRKPNPGMALAAKDDFPDIDFSKSVMVGNHITDMQFGRCAGMRTVYLHTTKIIEAPHADIDIILPDLKHFAARLP